MSIQRPIAYFEPNREIEYRPEDLNVGIYLEVEVPRRGIIEEETYVAEATFGSDKQDFFEEADGVLSTSYSDITLLEITNGGHKESIGIETINIKYNSWYFPEVNIKFVDVRGNAVFNPYEKTNDPETKDSARKPFLSCFFMFPYPIFKLTVKGYYGKPVTYRLTVKDVRSQFNASTGNFEINVNFIGYMYSYLTDVPMRMLLISPYINYDDITSELGVFTGGETKGQVIPSFVDFIRLMSEGVKEMEGNEELRTVNQKIQTYISAQNSLDTIKTNYINFVEFLKKNFIIKPEDFYNNTSIKSISITYNEANKTNQVANEINQVATSLNHYINTIISTWKKLKSTDSLTDIFNNVELLINNEKNNKTYYGEQNIEGQDSLIDRDKKPRTYEIYMNFNNDIKTLDDIIIKIKNILSELNEGKEDLVKKVYDNVLCWQPTLRNIFEMTLSHLDKFYENMARCIDNIKMSSKLRLLSDISVDTDCNAHSSDITVYPFPAFYNKDNEYLWIGEVPNANKYNEKDLVEKIISATKAFRGEIDDAEKDYEVSQEQTLIYPYNGIPTLLYDLEFGNAYRNDGNNLVGTNEDNPIPLGAKIFAKRLMLRKIYNSNYTPQNSRKEGEIITTMIDAKTFGEIEAMNFLNVVNNHDEIKQDAFFTAKKAAVLIEEYMRTHANSWFTVTDIEKYHIVDSKLKHNGGMKEFDENDLFFQTMPQTEYEDNGKVAIPEGYFKNAIRMYSDNEFNEKIKAATNYVSDENYYKVFSNKNGDINEFYHDDEFLRIDKTKGFLRNDEFFNDIQEKGEVKLSAGYKLKNDIKPITLGDFSFDINHDIDFFPCMEINESDYTWQSVNSKISKRLKKNGKERKKSAKAYCSFSCKKYWDIGSNETWKDIQSSSNTERYERICDDIMQDFFISIGLNTAYVSDNLSYFNKMESHGIVRIPYLQLMAIGYRCLKAMDGVKFDTTDIMLDTDTAKTAIDFYKKNYHTVVDKIVNILLDDRDYTTDDDNIGIIYAHLNKEEYFVKQLNENQIEFIEELLNSSVCLYYLHGSFKLPNYWDEGSIRNFFETSEAVTAFLDKISSECGLNPNEEEEMPTMVDENNNSSPLKLGVYNTLKNLYDRWKFGAYRKDGEGVQYKEAYVTLNNFRFRNVFNEDIGDKYLVNVDKFIKLITSISNGENDMSVYSFLFELCGIADCMMLSLPVNIFDATKNNDNLKEMFTPHNYISAKDEAAQTTFIVTLRNKESEHLSFQPSISEYKDDGVDFTNYNVTSDSNANTMGVFGVTYGLNNQHYFKDIKVSMDKPKVTEQSLGAMMQIVNGNASGSTGYARITHDLYDTYSSHSYNCTVDMMGNAQIMPMLYFQLNNIPLFKGGYLIVNAEHTINNQGMTTTFIGNRISKYQFNLNIKGLEYDVSAEGGSVNKKREVNYVDAPKEANAEKLRYSKEDTIIIIDAGHVMKTPGKESPDLNSTTLFSQTDIERSGDGILNPKDINGNLTYRYREYWGNRKIASQLANTLKKNGFKVEMLFNNSKDAKDVNFTKKADEIYESQKLKGGSAIIISIHSNAVGEDNKWGGGNYWTIYKQSPDYVAGDINKWVYPTHAGTSDLLARCIAKKAKIVFEEIKEAGLLPTVNKGGYNQTMSVHEEPKEFTNETKSGYRPTTFCKAPSVLSENLFHNTQTHIQFLASQKGRDAIVRLHYEGIMDFFANVPKV